MERKGAFYRLCKGQDFSQNLGFCFPPSENTVTSQALSQPLWDQLTHPPPLVALSPVSLNFIFIIFKEQRKHNAHSWQNTYKPKTAQNLKTSHSCASGCGLTHTHTFPAGGGFHAVSQQNTSLYRWAPCPQDRQLKELDRKYIQLENTQWCLNRHTEDAQEVETRRWGVCLLPVESAPLQLAPARHPGPHHGFHSPEKPWSWTSSWKLLISAERYTCKCFHSGINPISIAFLEEKRPRP